MHLLTIKGRFKLLILSYGNLLIGDGIYCQGICNSKIKVSWESQVNKNKNSQKIFKCIFQGCWLLKEDEIQSESKKK